MKKDLWISQAIAGAMLLWALYPDNPYGYYILLRWVVCPCFIYTGFQIFKRYKPKWGWVPWLAAVIYNPLLPLHLSRELWVVLNLAGILVGAWSILALKVNVPKRLWQPAIVLLIGFYWVHNLIGLPFEKAIIYFAGTETTGVLVVASYGEYEPDHTGRTVEGYSVEYSFQAGGKVIDCQKGYSGDPCFRVGRETRIPVIYWKHSPTLMNIPVGPEKPPSFFWGVIVHSMIDIILYGLLVCAVIAAYRFVTGALVIGAEEKTSQDRSEES